MLYSSISSVTKLIKNNFSSIENRWLLTWRSLFQSPGSKESICVGKWTYLSLITTEAVHLKNNLTKVHSVKTWHEEILWLIDEMQNNYIKKSFFMQSENSSAWFIWWKVQETMRWAAHGNEENSQSMNGVDLLDEWDELRGWRGCWTRIRNRDLN